MRISPFRVLILGVIIVLIAAGIYFGAKSIIDSNARPTNNSPQTGQPTQVALVPSQAQPGNTAKPGTVPTTAPGVPVNPAQPTDNDTYPVLVCDGTKPVLNVAFDGYAGFYPLVYRVMAMPASDQYCIGLMPKWYGPDFDKNGWSEATIEQKLITGEIDVYFASNGALALYDANSGLVVWSTDQSAGADAIVARNNISVTGKPTFNDILGRTILLSKGSADHYFALKMAQTVGFTPDMVNFQFADYPVTEFKAGVGDLVTYWDPPIRDAAAVPDTTVLVTTKYWRTISDYIVVSHNADDTKQNAVAYFLADYNTATEAFTKANVAETAALLVNFKFDGFDMAEWLWLDKADPAGSLNSLLDGVALAKLNDNVTMFEQDPTGSNLVIDQFVKTHNTWLFGGVYDNGEPDPELYPNPQVTTLFNPNLLITSKYVQILTNGGAKQVPGDFNNKYDTNVSTTPPQVDLNTLITLPELLTLPYKNIKFVENRSDLLVQGEEEKLLALVQPIANLMAESDDSVIVIRGGSGYFTTNPSTRNEVIKFAFKRAQYIRSLLSEELNIPIQRMIIDPNVLLPESEPTPAELPNFMVVIIKVVNSGNYK